VTKRRRNSPNKWFLADLHLHTPASNDYLEEGVSYLDILQKAESRGLNIISFTDHNTVAGYERMQDDIQQLEMLEKLGRIESEEKRRLSEYRRLLKEILLLPGFEFTATFGFHILGIFPPEKSIRELEHLLLSLNVPAEELDLGSSTVGATSDVLTAYRMIHDAGGLVIAAHANSNNGVAMRGFPLGGQTKIAYTQDLHLHALEVTDLEQRGRRTTAAFFSGTKPEYPRRMHCIQGSDAHRIDKKGKNLGVGDRATEFLLKELSFSALKELFQSNDFSRSRAHRVKTEEPFDYIQQALEEGSSIIQEFHESMTVRGGHLYSVIADVCAFANTNGGTVYIGLSSEAGSRPVGVSNPQKAVSKLETEISNRISPPLECQVDSQKSKGQTILRVLVPRGDDPPYAVDGNKIYVRDESETGLAVRDEIVQLVVRGGKPTISEAEAVSISAPQVKDTKEKKEGLSPPKTGVEVVRSEVRDGVVYYTMHDLRNGNVVKNVTQTSARRLWAYAIGQYDAIIERGSDSIKSWKGDLSLLKRRSVGRKTRYDLVQKTEDGLRYFFGVTEDGIHGAWRELIGPESEGA
jgi:hypothetical protein